MLDLEIDNLRCNYLLTGSVRSPSAVKGRLDSISKELLEKDCDRTLSRAFREGPSIVFIKDLRVDFSLNLAEPDDRALSNIWADNIASAVNTALSVPDDERNVIRFKSNTEYVASFVVDLLNGAAWQKWYYSDFEPLRMFDNRRVVMELLSRERAFTGEILLRLLDRNLLGRALTVLEESDVKTVFDDYLDINTTKCRTSFKELSTFLVEVIEESSSQFIGGGFLSFKNCLLLYFSALKKRPELGRGVKLKRAVKFTLLLNEFSGRYGSRVAESDDLEGFLKLINAGLEGDRYGFSTIIKDIVAEEGKAGLLEIINGVRKASEKTRSVTVFTPFGGLFFFIRTILDTGLHLIIENSRFPGRKNLPRTKVFLLFLAQKIAGQKSLSYEGVDTGLLLWAGFKNLPTPALLMEFTGKVTTGMNMEFLDNLRKTFPLEMQTIVGKTSEGSDIVDFETTLSVTKDLIYKFFTARLRRFEKSSPEYIFKNFVCRESEINLEEGSLAVKLQRKPLDVVLRLSGFIEDIKGVSWLDGRDVSFSLKKGLF